MNLSLTTISDLADLITGNSDLSPYRTQNDLEIFFQYCHIQHDFDIKSLSRFTYTQSVLLKVNNSEEIKNIIILAFDLRYFSKKEFSVYEAVSYFNKSLVFDGYQLIQDGLVYRLDKIENHGCHIKNIIFAANGPKPEIILNDATTNDIKIVKNQKYCLVYDYPIQHHGLLFKELVTWWKIVQKQECSFLDASRNLYKRLKLSLSSKPEKHLFEVFFRLFYDELNFILPALIPQVYLHYDPYTIKALKGQKRLMRQRMDFLLLFPNNIKIVIEIDGKQHYSSENNQPSPKLYAQMVEEDRKLKLAGYEVYRFGGYEFEQPDTDKKLESFFRRLLEKYKFQEYFNHE